MHFHDDARYTANGIGCYGSEIKYIYPIIRLHASTVDTWLYPVIDHFCTDYKINSNDPGRHQL